MTEMMNGKAALVTGAGRGIGRASALALAREGASVVVADLVSESAEETVALIRAAGGQATAVSGDVSRPESVKAWVKQVEDAYGRIDCAVNNAAIASGSVGAAGLKMHEWTEDAFDRLIEVNLKSVWLSLREEITAILGHGQGGSIVNMSSIAGLVALHGSTAYGASKNGVIGLTKVAAVEYAVEGIRVNAICPGYIDTEMARPHMEKLMADVGGKIPAGKVGTVENIAETALWLCSDRSGYVTGQAIAVDGGYVAQ